MPKTGRAAEAPLDGPGAGAAEASEARMALIEAAATRTAQEIFFMSIFSSPFSFPGDEEQISYLLPLLIVFLFLSWEWRVEVKRNL